VDEDAVAQLPWKMLFLLAGGGALGEAIKSSELLELISRIFGKAFSTMHIFVQVYSFFFYIVSSFSLFFFFVTNIIIYFICYESLF
jgi:di/tricarboxylate transporter